MLRTVVLILATFVALNVLATPARASAKCSDLQPQLDLSKFGTNVTIRHPRIWHAGIPNYPRAMEAGVRSLRGLVSICVLVNETGRPTNLSLLHSAGNTTLDDAAFRAARATTFTPGRINGQPVKMSAQLDYRFDLR